MTWSWEEDEMGKDSQLIITLHETEIDGVKGTELILLHEKLNNAIERAEHNSGWAQMLISILQWCEDRLPEPATPVEKEL